MNKLDISEWGTFRDSLKAPVHSWFTYPAGFSYKAVEHTINRHKLRAGIDTIYDPFMGSGTTNIVAKVMGLNSIGVEAHPFVYHNITLSKFNWDLRFERIHTFIDEIKHNTKALPDNNEILNINKDNFPELVRKCFLPDALYNLWFIRESIKSNHYLFEEERKFLMTALICSLRDVSIAATGWPYIAPNKIKITSMSKNAVDTFIKKVFKMINDLLLIKEMASDINTSHHLILGDSRATEIKNESVDHIFTSPPYLNNFDYADRTRLEMYFTGEASDWGDISKKIRTKLMTSATTQISRTDPKYDLSEDLKSESPKVYAFLKNAKNELDALRKVKGGKKSYDLLVSGYFNDMYMILKDNFRVLKPGSTAIYILGDSAPYGIHIPTDELIGMLGVDIGFQNYEIEILRERGGKWAKNPQRHSVPLRETLVILKK
ncbi:DNA methyltransferase [Enterobacteriaceae bacterium LUAb1]